MEQNFLVIPLDRALQERAIPGVRETIPTHRSLAIVYDPGVVRLEQLSWTVRELEQELDDLDTIKSRLVSIPIWYDDPWSLECALAHGVGNNIEYSRGAQWPLRGRRDRTALRHRALGGAPSGSSRPRTRPWGSIPAWH